MDNSLLAVRDINHNYIVIERGKKMKKDEDSIQLWRRTAKTEYPDPPDTGIFIVLRSAV